MSDDEQTTTTDEQHDLRPEPLDIDLEDVIDAFPHGEPEVHPGDADVQAPG